MGEYINVVETFGCDVFNDSVMQARLPKKIYKELKKTIEEGKELSMEIADVVAVSYTHLTHSCATAVSSPSPAWQKTFFTRYKPSRFLS